MVDVQVEDGKSLLVRPHAVPLRQGRTRSL